MRSLLHATTALLLVACGDDAGTPADAPGGDAAIDAPAGDLSAPTNFTATPDATGVQLAWTPPSAPSYASVIVVRRALTQVASAPMNGMTYAASATLGPGDTVIYAGTATSFADTTAVPGTAHYAVFAASTSQAWSPPARASALAPSGLQEGTLTVTLAGTAAVTVNQQPRNVLLGATAVYDSGAQTLTVSLTLTSGFVRNMFAPKVVLASVNQGTLTADGTLGSDAYRRAGIGIAPSGQAAVDLVFTGVDGTTDPINITLRIVDHAMVIVGKNYAANHGYGMVDTGTLTEFATAPCDTNLFTGPTDANRNGNCPVQGGALNADASRMFVGHRQLPIVRAIDPVTASTVAATTLATGLGAVTDVALDPSGTYVYALLVVGAHMYASGSVHSTTTTGRDIALVKLDAATLTEQARLVLATGAADDLRARRVAISRDGSRAAVTMLNQGVVRLIDLATFTEIDTDTVTAEVQPIDLSANGVDLKQVEFTNDGTALYAMMQNSSTGLRVSLADYTTTAAAMSDSTSQSGGLHRASDGTLWAALASNTNNQGLVSIDTVGTITPITTTASGRSVLVSGGRVWFGTDSSTIELYSTTTRERIDVDADDTNGVTDIDLADEPSHWMSVTPF